MNAAVAEAGRAEPIDVVIERIGAQGDGIAEDPRGRFYVPGTVAGDRVRVRPSAVRGDGRSANLVELLAPGPGCRRPACRHFGHCGGCTLQHLDDASYAAWKLERVSSAVSRAGIAPAETAPLVRTEPSGRRRAVFVAERPQPPGAVRLGFHVRRGHTVVDVDECPVLAPDLLALIPGLRSLMGELLSPGERTTLSVTALADGIDLVVALPQPPGPSVREQLALFAEDADLARLSWVRGGSAAAAGAAEPIAHRRPATAVFAGVPVTVPPGGFLQASAAGERALVAAVLAATAGRARIADLFCGAGTFTLPLAARGARVDAVDGDADALAALAVAARSMPHVRCERRDLFTRPLAAVELEGYDAVVFDPPRSGAATQARALASSPVPLVVAVSCNPDTFARDARVLAAGGYRLTRVTPVDQFLWSPHVELCAVFRR